ncbi:galactose/binding-like domain protein [Ranid herpesvirus 3]|uniref:Galactose/binding-like domain protein n=1 Tax=Ranid herpesvirus 3 TaxID=1987509 RepID=A0A1X9T5D6_9VIRU|nr:galactose/binding-like domain protein [Ranid herpesvirus 3]ARR28911.1 galactose/binding-like domain protein [Ranid herpesvirus 3]
MYIWVYRPFKGMILSQVLLLPDIVSGTIPLNQSKTRVKFSTSLVIDFRYSVPSRAELFIGGNFLGFKKKLFTPSMSEINTLGTTHPCVPI